MLYEYFKKVKSWISVNKGDLYIAVIIFLVGLSSFGLGRLSVLWPDKEPIEISNSKFQISNNDEISATAVIEPASVVSEIQGKYVASKSGTAYHFPWCPSASNIKESNKIWFQTKEEAERAGYRPAANCEGL